MLSFLYPLLLLPLQLPFTAASVAATNPTYYSSLIKPRTIPQVECLYSGPSSLHEPPISADCDALAKTLYADPDAEKPQTFSGEHRSEPYIPLPYTLRHGSCQLTVLVDGRPYYEVATLHEFADIATGTVRQCLMKPSGGGTGANHALMAGDLRYVGAKDNAGENNALIVYVTALWNVDTNDGGGGGGTGGGTLTLPLVPNMVTNGTRSGQGVGHGRNATSGSEVVKRGDRLGRRLRNKWSA